jgi:spore maturation protein CgeB
MKFVIFGLSISSSWGNGHATLWRGLCRALDARGHRIVFFERDVPYYANTRDSLEFPGCSLRLYDDWANNLWSARNELQDADVAMVTSYCPDGVAAAQLVLDSRAARRVFYDLDTPVTLARLDEGQSVDYLPPEGLGAFDLVLSYTGGDALYRLQTQLGARRVAPLYGSVDLDVHRPAPAVKEFAGDLSYLGTYAADRQETLERLLITPARRAPYRRFVIGGAQYPHDFPWTKNIFFVRHLPPAQHPDFYCSSRATLNLTRRAMAAMGFCPQGRLFEAAACGVPILTDDWEGLDEFYEPGREILVCRTPEDTLNALDLGDELRSIGRAARERTVAEHTAAHRAKYLEDVLQSSFQPAFRDTARAGHLSTEA